MVRLNRREFLVRSGTGMAVSTLSQGALLSGWQEETAKLKAPLDRKGPAKRVLVIGAGLAGLSAGYELSQAGHDVTILEARTRPGGRVLTLRAPFADGLHVDAGASTLPAHHDLTMKYVSLFGLSILPYFDPTTASLARVYHVHGKRSSGRKWPVQFNPEEKRLSVAARAQKYFFSAGVDIGDPMAADWPPDSLQGYDEITVAELMRQRGATPEAVRQVSLAYFLDLFADGVELTSALYMLRDAALNPSGVPIFKIKGGMDLLPKAFAGKLADRIHYGVPVVRIERSDQGVEVVFRRAKSYERMRAEHLICTVPFPILRNIEVFPRFSAEKRGVIEKMPLASCTRLFLQIGRRFWLDEGFSGFALTDLPIKFVFDSTSGSASSRGILECYVPGPAGDRLSAMSEEQRVRFGLEQLENVHPGVSNYFEGGISKSWKEDPWARGAYAYFKPGQMGTLYKHVAPPEGRVHFAGDHTSPNPGWLQGALFSGLRAAREIHDAKS